MSDLKRDWFFRKWKGKGSKSTLKNPTSQTYPGHIAPKWENPANSVVASTISTISTISTGEDVPKKLEVLPNPGSGALWGLAYKQLLAENEPLVRHYEEVFKTAGIVADDSAADIQEQIQAVLGLKRKQVLQKQWTLQWGNKPIKVRIQIDRIVKIIGAFKDAGSVAANVDPLHAGLPWAGICFLLSPMLNDSEQGEVLLSGLEMITDLVARHRIVDEYLARDPRLKFSDLDSGVGYQKLIIKLYTKVLEFQAKAACYLSRGTLIRFARNIPKIDDWATLQSNIVRIETECRDYTSFKFAMDQQSSMRSLIESLDEQEERLKDLIANQNLQQNAALMVTRLISDISVGQDHEDIRTRLGSRYWDSGQWLFKSRQYLDWATCDCPSMLWLQGSVGVGKSCMTSIVIQHFLANAIDNRVAFFYCSQEHSSSADVLRSLLAQMSYGTDGDLVQPVREWFELQTGSPFRMHQRLNTSVLPHLARKISSKECVELLREILVYTTQTNFMIDAIDECHDHYELLGHLEKLQGFSNLKIFISSRMGIYPKYKDKFFRSNVIEHFDCWADMKYFIDCEISSPARRDQSGMTPAQAKLLRKVLIAEAHGMFRWVELQLDVFLNRNHPILHPADVQTKLDKLLIVSNHPSLTSIYSDLLSLNTQDQPYRRALAIKALQWVLCAFKPLTIEGLAQAVALDSDGSTDTVVTGNFLLQVCGSFIVVTNSGSVRFSHSSAKEFSLHHLLLDVRGVEYSLSNAHAQVAETCLSFLLSFENALKWASLPTNCNEEAAGLSLTGFEMYACFFWASHCGHARMDKDCKRLEVPFDKFVSVRSETVRESNVTVASVAFQKWISLLWRVFQTDSNIEDSMRYRLEDAISDPPAPLFTVCIWGCTNKALRLMVQNGQSLNLRNSKGKSCLYLACENGHNEIVNTLIRSQAGVDAGHERWGSDLHAAASSGRLTVFLKALECGAQVNPPEGFYGRTIDAAIRGGDPAIVTHALMVGAEVWLPSPATPTQPRERRSVSPHSIEDWVSDTSSEGVPVFSGSVQHLVFSTSEPSFDNKDDTISEQYDLLGRLRKASLRRRELLNYWRQADRKTTVGHGVSDVPAIMNETRWFAGKIRETAFRDPFPIKLFPTSYSECYYCFRLIRITQSASWKHHVTLDLLPYICPFADCDLKDKMWGVFSEWEAHLNDQHPIPKAQCGDPKRYAFTCKICRQDFHSDNSSLGEESNNSFRTFRTSHYAGHMERIAWSVVKDYEPGSSASSRKQTPKSHVKRRRRRRYRSGSSPGSDEEAISGWSSEGSTGSQG